MSVLLLVIVVSRPQLIAFISNGAVSVLPGFPQVLGQFFCHVAGLGQNPGVSSTPAAKRLRELDHRTKVS
jgi:hypothetical protein